MPQSSSIRAGRAFVELFADDSKLVRGLRRAEKKLKAFGDRIRNFGLKMAGLGSAMLAPLAASAKVFSGYGDQVAKMAKRTGLSVETLSELRFVASQTGTEFQSLEMGFRRMQRSIYDAGRGMSTAVDALTDLGLRFDDLNGLSPEDQFKLLADRIGRVEDPTKKAAIAMTLFGRTGTNLLPMFAAGTEGIEQLQAEARRLGLTMSGEDAKAAEDFTDALDSLWKVVKMGAFNIGAALAPAIQDVVERVTEAIVKVSAWIKANRGLVVAVAKIAGIIVAGGIAIAAFGVVISGLGSVLGILATVATSVVGVLKLLGAAIAFLVSPVGLVISAVAALAGYLVYATIAGGEALGRLGEKFFTLKNDAMTAYQGIADALASGDIGLAAKILWLTLKLEWLEGTKELRRILGDFWLGFQCAWELGIHTVAKAWLGLMHTLKSAWVTFSTWHKKAVETTANWMAKRFVEVQGLLDPDLDVDQMKHDIDSMSGEELLRIDREANTRQQELDDAYETQKTLAEQMHADENRWILTEGQARQDAATRALAAARAEWQDAIQGARTKRQTSEDDAPDGLDDPDSIFNRLKDALAGLGDVVHDQAEKIGVRGTFNAVAVRGLQAGDAADRTAKATEKTAKYTKKLYQSAEDGGLTFT